MKIVIASDNHGDSEILKKILLENADANLFLHAGDSEMSAQDLYPFRSVKGNRDYFNDLSASFTIETPYGLLYLCHGHALFQLNKFKILKTDCKIFVHGHYHQHYVKKMNDIYIVSPGSTSKPRDNSNGTYLIITFKDNEPNFEFKGTY